MRLEPGGVGVEDLGDGLLGGDPLALDPAAGVADERRGRRSSGAWAPRMSAYWGPRRRRASASAVSASARASAEARGRAGRTRRGRPRRRSRGAGSRGPRGSKTQAGPIAMPGLTAIPRKVCMRRAGRFEGRSAASTSGSRGGGCGWGGVGSAAGGAALLARRGRLVLTRHAPRSAPRRPRRTGPRPGRPAPPRPPRRRARAPRPRGPCPARRRAWSQVQDALAVGLLAIIDDADLGLRTGAPGGRTCRPAGGGGPAR